MSDKLPARKEFDQIVTTLRVKIPESIDETINKLNGLGSLLTAGDWARAAFVRAWVEKGKGGPKTGRELAQLSMREFATLGIHGLSTKDAVRHYWNAWEATRRPVPQVGAIVALPEDPFPEWGSNTIATKWTGDQESYTPAKYIEAGRLVMGSIDLDPASCKLAQKTVKATTYYTKEDNGLDKPWNGNIFLNPPYSHPDIKHFVDKLLAELKPGQQAILLTNNNTDTGFFHDAAGVATALCFTRGRINFLKQDGSVSSPTNGQVFYYFGDYPEVFKKHFDEFGIIL
jgi:ParB family chromosome partitioning protein